VETTDYLSRVVTSLEADGYEVSAAELGAGEVLVARRSQFRWSWMATQMVSFAVLHEAPSVSADFAAEYAAEALEYARRNKGGLPRGLQSGVMAFPVIASAAIEPAAADWARERPRKHWAMEENPVLADTAARQAYRYEGTIAWGRIYSSFRRETMEKHFVAPLSVP
jgi:hypothetical protein